MRKRYPELWLAIAFLVVFAVAYLAGCKSSDLPPPFGIAGNATARIDARAELIQEQAEKIGGIGNRHRKELIVQQAEKIRDDASETQQAINDSAKEYRKVQGERDAAQRETASIKADPWYKAMLWVKWGFRAWVSLVILFIVLRVVAVFISGPLGPILAHVATWGLGILTLGISAITSGADNYWFRVRAQVT